MVPCDFTSLQVRLSTGECHWIPLNTNEIRSSRRNTRFRLLSNR